MVSLLRQPRWLGFLALTLGLCVLFYWLGTWQWHRHQDRSAHNAAIHAAQDQPPSPLTELMDDPDSLPAGAEYREATASGQYVADGQMLQRNPSGRAGFAVITPLQLDTGGTLLVDRGFVPFSRTDVNAPEADVSPPAAPVDVVVRLRAPQDDTDRDAPDGQIYEVNPNDYPEPLPPPVYAAYGELVEQTPPAPEELELPEAADLGMGPHLFYAFQWWSFIAIALVGFVLLLRREAHAMSPSQGDDTPVGTSPR
ncbi:MAG TPA: SURF1 family protein [Actinomycetes bacterium]|nr:SURF1 family protein [Actinomycetes bacterium]